MVLANRLTTFLLLLLLCTSVVSANNKMVTEFYKPTSKLFSIVVMGDGDAYYDERCVDVTQYLASGYSSVGVDQYGCPLVSKRTLSSTINYFTCDITYMERVSFNRMCQEGKNYQYGSCVGTGLGSEWSWTGTCAKKPDNNRCFLQCGYYFSDIKGGMERVLNYCTYDANDLLVAETFAGPQSLDKFDLRYPVKSFCRAHPSVITNADTLTSYTSTNVMETLINGGTVMISTAETMTVFYVIENNYQLPTICDSGDNLALNVETGMTCSSTLGFAYICSEGVFDALTGVCVVQPGISTICEKGRYDLQTGTCVYNPPLQVDCGDPLAYFSVDRDVCIYTPQEEFVCPAGYDLHLPTQSECVANGYDWLLCPQCPIDKVCPVDVCVPRCSDGIRCELVPETKIICDNANATIISGECVVEGVVIELCPDDSHYNPYLEVCVEEYDKLLQDCPDGTVPTKNSLTGKYECFIQPISYVDCSLLGPFVFDMMTSTCVPEIAVYNPTLDEFVIYKEQYKGCSNDDDCKVLGDSFVCNKGSGYCHTNIGEESMRFLSLGVDKWVMIIIGVILLLFIMKKKNR